MLSCRSPCAIIYLPDFLQAVKEVDIYIDFVWQAHSFDNN